MVVGMSVTFDVVGEAVLATIGQPLALMAVTA
jgi:hypothetical protein